MPTKYTSSRRENKNKTEPLFNNNIEIRHTPTFIHFRSKVQSCHDTFFEFLMLAGFVITIVLNELLVSMSHYGIYDHQAQLINKIYSFRI